MYIHAHAFHINYSAISHSKPPPTSPTRRAAPRGGMLCAPKRAREKIRAPPPSLPPRAVYRFAGSGKQPCFPPGSRVSDEKLSEAVSPRVSRFARRRFGKSTSADNKRGGGVHPPRPHLGKSPPPRRFDASRDNGTNRYE